MASCRQSPELVYHPEARVVDMDEFDEPVQHDHANGNFLPVQDDASIMLDIAHDLMSLLTVEERAVEWRRRLRALHADRIAMREFFARLKAAYPEDFRELLDVSFAAFGA